MNIWRWAALFAAGTFILMMRFPAIPGLHACAVATDPIVALELARAPAAVAALFPAPCARTLIFAQTQGLRLDTFGFIPVYTAFLIVSAIAARKSVGPSLRPVAGLAIVFTLLAATADLVENSRVFAILGGLPGTDRDILILSIAARAKFILLGVALPLLGLLHLKALGWRRWLGLGSVVGAPIAAIAVFIDPDLIAAGASLAWFSLLGFALSCAIRPPRWGHGSGVAAGNAASG